MRSIRARFPVAAGDRGMTLVEVMVAMFVFAILSSLVLATMLQVVSRNRASEAQHVAANLAAEQIDLARDAPDLFSVVPGTWSVDVNGTTFEVVRETAWVSETSDDVACGAGGGNLRFKRVNITVTWSGMPETMAPVRADTVIDPAQRINDPAKGTVLVAVVDSRGNGVSGVAVNLAVDTGGAAVAPRTTDAQGCAYFLQVTRGTYDLSIAKSGYIGVSLESTPTQQDISVQPGATASFGFQYDQRARLNVEIAPGAAVGASTVRLPANLPLTFISTYGVATAPLNSSTTTVRSYAIDVHPRITYRLLGGQYGRSTGAECTAPDPTAWPAVTALDLGLGIPLGTSLAAGQAPELSAEPGSTTNLTVPMGLVRLNGSNPRGVQAVSTTGRAGDPTCASTITYTFGNVGANAVIALPYGSWRITSTSGAFTPQVLTGGTSLLGVTTLDPRQVAP